MYTYIYIYMYILYIGFRICKGSLAFTGVFLRAYRWWFKSSGFSVDGSGITRVPVEPRLRMSATGPIPGLFSDMGSDTA